MKRPVAALILAVAALAGCEATPTYTQAQLTAIETRVVDADFDETFNAAAGAMFDAGYIISMSDREGGLLTAHQMSSNEGWDRFWHGDIPRRLTLSIKVRKVGPGRCEVRVKSAVDEASKVDKEMVDEIWVLMQRQVLMSEPPDV